MKNFRKTLVAFVLFSCLGVTTPCEASRWSIKLPNLSKPAAQNIGTVLGLGVGLVYGGPAGAARGAAQGRLAAGHAYDAHGELKKGLQSIR